VVFPVSLDSMASAQTLGSDSDVMQQLQMVPGPASGEGCSASGGCASCPYMKMNTLTSLLRVCELVSTLSRSFALSPQHYFCRCACVYSPLANASCGLPVTTRIVQRA
jgi:quinolinate synthase